MHLERLITIIEKIVESGKSLTVREITEATNLPQPSCYRLVQDLIKTGLLQTDSKKTFFLGKRFERIAKMNKSDFDLKKITNPILKKLANKYQTSFFLSRLKNQRVEIIQVGIPEDEQFPFLHPGLGFRPMHACACAKAIVAFADNELQDTLIKSRLKPYTRSTRTNPFELRIELKNIKTRGFAECIQEMEIGVCSVAAPVHLPELSPILSIGAIGALKLFTSQFRGELANVLIKEASVLSTLFGKSYIDLKAIM